MYEINVTPFIDVMLVLAIIFMVAAAGDGGRHVIFPLLPVRHSRASSKTG